MDAQRTEYFKERYRALSGEELGELLTKAARNDGQLAEEALQALHAVVAERSLDAGGLLAAHAAACAADGDIQKEATATAPRGWRKVVGYLGMPIGLVLILASMSLGRTEGVVQGLIVLVASICILIVPAEKRRSSLDK